MSMKEKVDELHKKREESLKLGGEKKIEIQHDQGKLTCRERIDLLFDKGTFLEFGQLARHSPYAQGLEGKKTPADGVVTGYGKINGRYVGVAAYDFTVLGGSMGAVGERKMARLREMVLRHRMPLVWLMDSAGARIHEFSQFPASFAGTGHLFKEQALMSGVIPQVCAMVGPGAAGTAYIPGLADFVPMVKGQSHMALGGPALVKAATGEEVDAESLGGSKIHCKKSGVADLEVENDEECIEVIKKYLSFFPSHCEEKPPLGETSDPIDRGEEELLEIVPENPRKAYDMYEVISRIVDDGDYFDMKPAWARNMITCLARVGGYPVGILANQPKRYGGVLDVDGADKATRFITLCDAFGIPLVFLPDVPGFMVGSKVEKEGIIRHGARMIHALSNATVPKVTIVLRKAYGAGYFVMCGTAYEPDYIAAWPIAEISVMGPEGMVGILSRSEIATMDDESKKAFVEQIRNQINPFLSAGAGLIDDVIDPRETRQKIYQALEMSWNKVVERPWKKHGVWPM